MTTTMRKFREKKESAGVFVKIIFTNTPDGKSELRYDLSLFVKGSCPQMGSQKAFQSDDNASSVFDILRSIELLDKMFRFEGLYIKLVCPAKHGHDDSRLCDNSCELVLKMLRSFHFAVSRFLVHFQQFVEQRHVSIKFFSEDLKSTASFTDDWLSMLRSMNQQHVALEGIVCQPSILATLFDMPFYYLNIKVTLMDRLRFLQNLTVPAEDRVRTAIPDGVKMLQDFLEKCLESNVEGRLLRKFHIGIAGCETKIQTELECMLFTIAKIRFLEIQSFEQYEWMNSRNRSFRNKNADISWEWVGVELSLRVELYPEDVFAWDELSLAPPPLCDLRATLKKELGPVSHTSNTCNCCYFREKL